MHLLICIFTVIALFQPAYAKQGELLNIEFKDQVKLDSSLVQLGDLVKLNGLNTDFINSIEPIIIAQAPRPYQNMSITQFEVNARLERHIPDITSKLKWSGATAVRVTSKGISINSSELSKVAEKELKRFLNSSYPQSSAEIKVSQIEDSRSIIVPLGEIKILARISNDTSVRERFPVWVDLFIDNKLYSTKVVWFSVSIEQPVWVAVRDVEQYAPLSNSDWVINKKNIAGLSSRPLLHDFSDELRTKQLIRAGSVLTETNTEIRPMVVKGELITVQTHHGSVTLTLQGMALNDGNKSEEITVESLSSGETYRAIVTENNFVEVN